MTDLETQWLAGLLEGEGHFAPGPPSDPNRPQIQLLMCDLDVVKRAAAMLGVNYVYTRPAKPERNWKESYRVILRGTRAVEIMRNLKPFMGERRQRQIDKALASYSPR